MAKCKALTGSAVKGLICYSVGKLQCSTVECIHIGLSFFLIRGVATANVRNDRFHLTLMFAYSI